MFIKGIAFHLVPQLRYQIDMLINHIIQLFALLHSLKNWPYYGIAHSQFLNLKSSFRMIKNLFPCQIYLL